MLATDAQTSPSLKQTPLHALHVASGGKMVPFAGYDMPANGTILPPLATCSACKGVRLRDDGEV